MKKVLFCIVLVLIMTLTGLLYYGEYTGQIHPNWQWYCPVMIIYCIYAYFQIKAAASIRKDKKFDRDVHRAFMKQKLINLDKEL